MTAALRVISKVFLALYILALVAFIVGTFGVFGQEKDPMSGVFLIPLGLPWNRLIDYFPAQFWPWLTALAPVINYLIIRKISLLFGKHG